jgi:hypothetical protein
MSTLQERESALLHKLFGDLKAEVPELGEVTYEATDVGTAPLGPNGFVFRFRLHAIAPDRFQLEATLHNARGEEVARNGWIKTEESATKILALVKYFATVALSP